MVPFYFPIQLRNQKSNSQNAKTDTSNENVRIRQQAVPGETRLPAGRRTKASFSHTWYWHDRPNGRKSLFPHAKEADVARRNMENRCAEQKALLAR